MSFGGKKYPEGRLLPTGEVALNDNPEDTLLAYVRAFESLDPDNVMPFYYLPCLLIAPMGVTLISDADAARRMALTLIEHARSQGYRRSEILDLNVKRLADKIATLVGVFSVFCSLQINSFNCQTWQSGREF